MRLGRRECFVATGFTFLFAPYFHPAMKALAPIRAALGIRTVFNLLGPLTNPAAPRFRLIGAYDAPTAELMAGTLAGMDIERAWVVHGAGGLGRSHAHRSLPGIRCAAGRGSPLRNRSARIRSGALRAGGAGGRRCRREFRGVARGIRRPRSRCASAGAGLAMRSRLIHRRPGGEHSDRNRHGARRSGQRPGKRSGYGNCGSLRCRDP